MPKQKLTHSNNKKTKNNINASLKKRLCVKKRRTTIRGVVPKFEDYEMWDIQPFVRETRKFLYKLDQYDMTILKEYKGTAYANMNYVMRMKIENEKLNRQDDRCLSVGLHMQKMFDKAPKLKNEIIVYRGVDMGDPDIPIEARNMFRNARRGSVIENHQFVSTTVTTEEALGFAGWYFGPKEHHDGYLLVIKVPKNTPYICMLEVPHKHVDEDEILFSCCQRFKVTKRRLLKLKNDYGTLYNITELHITMIGTADETLLKLIN